MESTHLSETMQSEPGVERDEDQGAWLGCTPHHWGEGKEFLVSGPADLLNRSLLGVHEGAYQVQSRIVPSRGWLWRPEPEVRRLDGNIST